MNNNTIPDFEKADLDRLINEIQKDRDLQFRIFWQTLTITAILFSLALNMMESKLGINFPFIFLAPHLILLPSTAIILNRARTANRKSGYIIVTFGEIAYFSNWEKDLSILRGKVPHRAATIRSMLITITIMELVCLLLFFTFMFTTAKNSPTTYAHLLPLFCCLYFIFYCLLISKRFRSFFCTRYKTSIQGFATIWADVKKLDIKKIENFPKWDADEWIDTRDNEVKVWKKNKPLWFDIVGFFWFLVYRSPLIKTNEEKTNPLRLSVWKPIIVAVSFWIVLTILFNQLKIDTILKNILTII